jgi:regulator of RNase E activity RraA
VTYHIGDRVGADGSLVDAYRALTTGGIGHRIDGHAMRRDIRPVGAFSATLAGPAVTVRAPGRDSTVCHKVMDLVQPGDIIVIDRGHDTDYACWGEMMTIAARLRGVAVVIVDGPVTDIADLRTDPMPVFATGVSPLTTLLLGEGGSINAPVECGGLMVSPGDLVVADEDGVLVFTQEEARQILSEVEEEHAEDYAYRARLLEGLRPSELAPIDDLINQRLLAQGSEGGGCS